MKHTRFIHSTQTIPLTIVVAAAALFAVPARAARASFPAAVVSAATFQPAVAPGSLASVFGSGMASHAVSATLDSKGNLPTTLDTIQEVTVGGLVAPLLYVSPSQINFQVPTGAALGTQMVVVTAASGTFSGTSQVQTVAPGVFQLAALRSNRGAVLNGITYQDEPFSITTPTAPLPDQRTRVVLFGSGWRLAKTIAVEATLQTGASMPLTVEFSGAEGYFAGLDQINAVVPPNLENTGVVSLSVVADGVTANVITTQFDEAAPDTVTLPPYIIQNFAGTGVAGNTGDNGPPTQATLQTPAGIAVDAKLNIYIADSANHVVRRVSAGGTITTFAGTGKAGNTGDGGLATSALLKSPVGLAIDRLGNLYIADASDNRVRMVNAKGIISTFAGNGSEGFVGDEALAVNAELFQPSAVAADPFGNVYIADTGNNRIRVVTSDGLISTAAGTGTAGYAGDGASAQAAEISAPLSLAVDAEGTVYFAGSDLRVRAIDPGGSMRTIAGTGEAGDAGDKNPPLGATFQGSLYVAVDRLQRLLISDTANHRVRFVALDSLIHPLAGTGTANSAGDGSLAIQAELNTPAGIATDPLGNAYIADSTANRVRMLTFTDSGDASCSAAPKFYFQPPVVVGGESITGYFQLPCPSDSATTVTLSSSTPGMSIPPTFTIPAGGTTGSFTIQTVATTTVTTVTISGTWSGGSVSGSFTTTPGAGSSDNVAAISVSGPTVFGGAVLTGRVTLGLPAPAAGVEVSLSLDHIDASVAASVLVPAGQVSADFLITTIPVLASAQVTVTGKTGSASVSTIFTVLPSTSASIQSFTFSPNPVTGGQTVAGTVTLVAPAPASGIVVFLSTAASLTSPATLVIGPGQTSATFTTPTVAVSKTETITMTATSANTVTATVVVETAGTAKGTIGSLTLNPSSVTSGQSSTGTVTLVAPAPTGGVLVALSSNSGSATIVASVTIPAGETSATFPINTTAVSASANVTITATSANSATVMLSLGAAGSTSGTISGFTISPAALTGGQTATGTVTLNAPAPTAGVLVTLTSNNGAATVVASVTIPAGLTSATFPVTTTSVSASATAIITASSANSSTASLTIGAKVASEQPGTISGLTLNPSSITGGQSTTGTVTLSVAAPTGGIWVDLSSDSAAVSVPASIVVPAGQTSATFSVSTTAVSAATTANITASSDNSMSASLTLAASGNSGTPTTGIVNGFTLSPSTVNGGQSSTGTIMISAAAPAGGVLVSLSSDNAAATVPASVTVPEGQSSITFTIATTVVSTSTTANITATSSNSTTAALMISVAGTTTASISGFTLNPSTVTGGQSSTGTVTLGAPAPTGGVLVTLSSDNTAATVPASVTIPAGQTSITFTVSTTAVMADSTANILATSGNATGASLTINAAGASTGTISGFTLNPSSLTGGQSSSGTVTLSLPAGTGGVVVMLASDNSAATVSASVTIPAGQSSGTFTVTTTAVSVAATANISATSANTVAAALSIGAAGTTTAGIGSFTLNPTSVSGGQSSTGTVTLSAPAPVGGVLVTLSSDNGAASVPASITIASGQTSGTFTVTTSAVGTAATANITVTSANSLTAPLMIGAAGAGTGSISSVTLSPSTVPSGQASTGTVTLSSPAGVGGVLVNLSSDNGAATVASSLTIPAGQSSGTFVISTTAVATTTTANITATSANSTSAALTISAAGPGSASIGGVTLNPTTVTGGQPSTGTVTLSAPAGTGGVLITLASNNGAATVAASLTIPAGQTSATFPVTTSVTGSTQTAVITATSANSVTAALTINITPPGQGSIQALTLNPNTVSGGTAATGTVTLAGPAPANGVLVQLTSSDTTTATLPVSITIAAGYTTGTFTVGTVAVSSSEIVTITASSSNNVTAPLTVNPGSASSASISAVTLNPTSVVGGGSSTGTVTLSSPAPANGVLVSLTSNDGNASVPSSVTIASGQTSGSFTVITSPVNAAQSAVITATSTNSVAANLQIALTPPSLETVASVALNPSSVVGGTGSTGTVTLTSPAPVNGVAVTLSSNNVAAAVPGSLVIAAGQTSATFAITTTAVSAAQSVTISAVSLNTATATLAVNPPCVQGLNLNVSISSLLTGAGLLHGTVTLTGPAPAGGESIELVGATGEIGRILVPADQNSASINLSVTDVLTLLGSTVQAVVNGCDLVSATITLGEGDAGPATIASLTLNPTSAAPGATVVGTVTLASPATGSGILVALATNNALTNVPATITIPAGATTGTFNIGIDLLVVPGNVTITAVSANTVSATLVVKL